MALVCIHDARTDPPQDPVAAVQIHGFFATMRDAQDTIQQLALKQTDVQAYIVDECRHWLPVQEPDNGSGVEEEEIRAPENDDKGSGKMGSVCDLRPNIQVQQDASTDNSEEVAAIFSQSCSKPNNLSKKEVKTQQKQLEDLLNGAVPSVHSITTIQAYTALREEHAMLRAFRRKIIVLHGTNHNTITESRRNIQGMVERHPEYEHQYLNNYKRALQQSETGLRLGVGSLGAHCPRECSIHQVFGRRVWNS